MKKTLNPSLQKSHANVFLKVIGISFLSFCTVAQTAIANTEQNIEVAILQQAKGHTVTGSVKSESGEPLIGVSVRVKGTSKGSITDVDGNFSIMNVTSNEMLEVSYVGYATISVRAGNTPLNITMKEDALNLNEVVVVGYGTQKKINLTGSVSAVNGKELANRPAVNTATMLEAQVPGLRVNTGVGQPGAENVSFRIRGQGTFSSAGSDPLILVNGVPGDISHLDPSVIESISVLKDAASASIYGARAANGVILVTTKQGTDNGDTKAHFSYNGN